MIQISHLTKIFNDKSGEVVALHDVNLEIGRGDIFGIIGMSGAGKSTLLRCLSTLEKPTSGAITLDGVDLATLTGKQLIDTRRKMGVVFQGYNLLMQRTVRQNVAFPLALERADRAGVNARVDELLELVGLSEKAESYPSQLSGGQKQRVLIARALAPGPQVLLLDEPFTGLDHPTQDSLTDLFTSLSEAGVAILMSTHDLTQAVGMADRLALLAGTIRAVDAPDNLRDPHIWMDTFAVRPDSALLRTIGLT